MSSEPTYAELLIRIADLEQENERLGKILDASLDRQTELIQSVVIQSQLRQQAEHVHREAMRQHEEGGRILREMIERHVLLVAMVESKPTRFTDDEEQAA